MFYAHFKFYVGAQKTLQKPPSRSLFFSWTREPILMPSLQTYFKNSNNGIELYGV